MQVFTSNMFCVGKYKIQHQWLEIGKIPTQLTQKGCPETCQVTLQLQRAVTGLQFSWQSVKTASSRWD